MSRMVDCEYRLQFKLFKYLKPLLLNEYKKNLNLNLLPPKNSYRTVKISLKKRRDHGKISYERRVYGSVLDYKTLS